MKKKNKIKEARKIMKKAFIKDDDFAEGYRAQIACFIMDNFRGYKKNKEKRDILAKQLFDHLYMNNP